MTLTNPAALYYVSQRETFADPFGYLLSVRLPAADSSTGCASVPGYAEPGGSLFIVISLWYYQRR
jgi:hypothetical protein